MTAHPPVMRAAIVRRTPAEAFEIFTAEIGAWWPLPSHGLFGDEAGALSFRDEMLIEQATDGREVVWGEVRAWEPPHRLVISWHPGRQVSDASQVAVTFEEVADGTRVVIEHAGWEAFGDEAMMRRRSYVGPNAWGYVLDHFADGAEVRADMVDTSALRDAYASFFAEAETGSFGPPAPGEWSAEQVVAHVALNDAAMVAVCQALVHGGDLRFENDVCQDLAVLEAYIEAATDFAGLIARGRTVSQLVLRSLERLSPEQLNTDVHCRLRHYDDVMVDAPRPWEAVAVDTQTAMHLPAHTQQLRDLRSNQAP